VLIINSEELGIMKRMIFFLGCAALLYNLSFAGDNVCRIDSLANIGGNQYSVGVFISNVDTIAGFHIPLALTTDSNGTIISIDSISFAGSRCSEFTFQDKKIDTAINSICISCVYEVYPDENIEPLYAGNGKVAQIYFRCAADTLGNRIFFQQTHFDINRNKLDFSFWKPNASSIVCRFESNWILLKP
jgi:hypothetical protein